MEQNIVIKGTPQKNKAALITIIVGALLLRAAFSVASYAFEKCGDYANYLLQHYYSLDTIYEPFGEFFINEFFSFECFFGYMIMLGVVVLVVGIIMKYTTEKCEITVTNEAVIGFRPYRPKVSIPLNQITAINRSAFKGISISSIGNITNFYCFENREEIIKAISYLLANAQPSHSYSAAEENNGDADRLKQLKKLLDAGVLTQEEFEFKKKEILGL